MSTHMHGARDEKDTNNANHFVSIVKFKVTFFYYFSLIVNFINVMVTFTLKTFHVTHTTSLQREKQSIGSRK